MRQHSRFAIHCTQELDEDYSKLLYCLCQPTYALHRLPSLSACTEATFCIRDAAEHCTVRSPELLHKSAVLVSTATVLTDSEQHAQVHTELTSCFAACAVQLTVHRKF